MAYFCETCMQAIASHREIAFKRMVGRKYLSLLNFKDAHFMNTHNMIKKSDWELLSMLQVVLERLVQTNHD